MIDKLIAVGYHVVVDDNNTPIGLISVSEAARRLKRSIEQVRRYLREGKLPGRRLGGQWFIDEADLEAVVATAKQHHIREATTMYRPETEYRAAYSARVEEVIAAVAKTREEIRQRLGGNIDFNVVEMLREDRESH